MKRKVMTVLCIFAFAIMPLFASVPHAVRAEGGSGGSAMPASPEKIEELLIKQGKLKASATPQEKVAAVQAYLQQKMGHGGESKGANPTARKQVEANEEALNAQASGVIRGRKLGLQVDVDPSTPQFNPLKGDDKLLLIAIQFSDKEYSWQTADGNNRTAAGPLHNQIPVPGNSIDLWVPDFNIQHYEDMLFTPGGWTFPSDAPRYAGEHRGSMHDYYLEQSYGKYTVDGKAYGWYTVDKPEAYYGDDSASGNDNLGPGSPKTLLADAVDVINKSDNPIPWSEYDTNGDCVIDHPLFIHAGVDQSGGGGAQGDDAIWAHSSSTWVQVAGPTADCSDGLYLYNYTIMPEDGGVGVFAHEFGHDLGLPDEYDTIYSGNGDSVGYWSLMSSGSWVGKPAQTQPSNISIWGRYMLGWVTNGENLAVTSFDKLTKDTTAVRLEQSEFAGPAGSLNAIRVNLPAKKSVLNTPYAGSWEFYGGKGDEIDTTLRRAVDLTGKSSASLSFWTSYDIEEQWDFGFVQVSTDGGATWKSLPIAGTRSDIVADGYPAIAENMPGFTGNSGGWVQKTYDLKDYVGKSILLQFRYMTDWGTSLNGFFVDDVSVTADGATLFSDGAETANTDWTMKGWFRFQGFAYYAHYYMMELRNVNRFEVANNDSSIVNFDNGLSNVYQYDTYGSNGGNPDEPWYYSYNPGLLLWYRDTSYTDNWTGVHPGGGYLLVVDSHPTVWLRPSAPGMGSIPWSQRVQTSDAPFSLSRTFDTTLGYWGVVRNYAGQNAVPNFDDSKSYWSSKIPDASVKTPGYGLLFRVLGMAKDGSAAFIGLGRK